MDITYSGREIIIRDKHVTLLDRFVLNFIRLLEPHTPYVIVSGYVAIIFGRSRGTEDVDILIPRLEREQFFLLHDDLLSRNYEFLNAEDAGGLYDMLIGSMGIRAAKKDQFIPNIELKFFKDEIDRMVFCDRREVLFGNENLFISPVEIQIAYKIWLGSPKDIEDALFLWEIFSNNLDRVKLKEHMRALGVSGDEYGIIL